MRSGFMGWGGALGRSEEGDRILLAINLSPRLKRPIESATLNCMNRSFLGSIGSGTQKFEQPLINVASIDQRLTTHAEEASGYSLGYRNTSPKSHPIVLSVGWL
jgi:hypothetical protein